jgi:hypothetical protein
VPADLELVGNVGYRTSDLQVLRWQKVADIEFCYLVTWTHSRCKLASIRAEESDRAKATITMRQPTFEIARTKEGVQVGLPNYVENALELLDEPGEWYLDRSTLTFYYQPRPGEKLARATVITPALETLVEMRGSPDHPVQHLGFRNLTFAEATWLQPSRIGHADAQANFRGDPTKPLKRDGKITTVHNENLKSPAHIVCRHAHDIRFDRCAFTRLGGAGVDIEQGSRDCQMIGCRFWDISGSAIQIGDVLKNDHHPEDERLIVRDNAVRNCLIRHCCLEYKGGVGVFVGYTQRTTVDHNEISNLPYSGVSVGWGWGEEDAGGGAYAVQGPVYRQPTICRENRITHNHIHHVMEELQDGGGIYTLGNQPGTLIANNHVHDNRGRPGGIYLDEGSGFIEVTGNLVSDVATPMNYNNRAQNRIATCPEHDNFFGAGSNASGMLKNTAAEAGLEPSYRDLIDATQYPPSIFMAHSIHIRVGTLELAGTLNDSPTAKALLALLPVRVRMSRWGDEYYGGLPQRLDLDESPDAREEMQVGELAYWPPGNALCVFFGPTPVSNGPAPRAASPVNPIGTLNGNVAALKTLDRSVTMDFTRTAT